MHIFKYFSDKIYDLIASNLFSDYSYAIYSLKKFDNKKPNLKNPKTFNEKLRWISLNCRNPLYSIYANKLAIKECLKGKINEQYIPKLLGHWTNAKDINWEDLPNELVLKTNHACGCNIIIRNKAKINREKISSKLNSYLKINYYKVAREWVYKDIPRRVLAEELLKDKNENTPIDYKFFCFNGNPIYIQVDIDRGVNHKRAFYSLNWDLIPISYLYPKPKNIINKPENLQEMICLAKKLSEGIPFVRVDLYALPEVKFGELTFFPEAAMGQLFPSIWNKKFGDLINLYKY